MQLLHWPPFLKWGQLSPGYFACFAAGFSGSLYFKAANKSPYDDEPLE